MSKRKADDDAIDPRAAKKLKGLSFDKMIEAKKKIQPVIIEGFAFDPLDDNDAALIAKLSKGGSSYRVLTDIETDMEWLYSHSAEALILTDEGKIFTTQHQGLKWIKPVEESDKAFLAHFKIECPPGPRMHVGTWAESHAEWKRRDEYLGAHIPAFSRFTKADPVTLSLQMHQATVVLHSKSSGLAPSIRVLTHSRTENAGVKVLLYDIEYDILGTPPDRSKSKTLSYANIKHPSPENFLYEIMPHWLEYDRMDPIAVMYAMWLKLVLEAKFKMIERRVKLVDANWTVSRGHLHDDVQKKLAREMDVALADVMLWLKLNDVPITLRKCT